MKHWLIVVISIIIPALFCSYAVAQDSSAEDEAELNKLRMTIEKHTEIATKTKLNADFVPGIVTVLYGDDLENRGIRTMWEALNLVPGIEVSLENVGGRNVMVRGVADTFLSGNTKILLDGVSVNVLLYAEAAIPLEIPIGQIERIEVIRGPGAAIHGEFAYTSVVNIITRKEGGRVFAGTGSFNTYYGGGILSWRDPDNNLSLSLNTAWSKTDGKNVQTGTDKMYAMGMGELSNAPGTTNEIGRYGSVMFNLNYNNFSLLAQLLKNDGGDGFGLFDALNFPEKRMNFLQTQSVIEVRQTADFGSSLKANFRLGWMRYEFEAHNLLLFPPGFAGIYNDGMICGYEYEESRFNGGIDLIWKGWNHHTLLLGLEFSRTDMGNVSAEANFDPITQEPLSEIQRFYGEKNFLIENRDRTIRSFTLQDEYEILENLTITAGLRYDDYNDVNNAFSPRLALVWRLNEKHILKAQYSKAFRPPTFFELYSINNPLIMGNPNQGFSTIDAYDLGYIWKKDKAVWRFTLFYSELKDMVFIDDKGILSNSANACSHGLELELEQEVASFLRLDANIAYVNTEDQNTGEKIPGSADWIGNAGLIYQFHKKASVGLQYRYVGARHREHSDVRDKLDGYQTVNITGKVSDMYLKGLTLRVGIKNLFNNDVRYPAQIGTYPQDYPRPGREWWTQISYQF